MPSDPIGLSGGLRSNGYVASPTAWVDPWGLSCCKLQFASEDKLIQHFEKHGAEFGAKSVDEYLQVGNDIIQNGHKVEYLYKNKNMAQAEWRTGYVSYMGNTSKGATKMGFVGTNAQGQITTIHTKSGKDLWKTLNGSATDKTINSLN